jgi:glycosyltransferase involved in cell wall biosynthesis
MFSIYLLTHNAEIDIAPCIESALLSDDVIVVDSSSSDRISEIASRYRVRIVQHPYESHGKQRTWMLQSLPTKYEWVYILEAEDRMTPELFQQSLKAIQNPEYIGYYVAERVMLMNCKIRHNIQYPHYQLRLFRKDKVLFTDYGETAQEVCDGATDVLGDTYPDYTCSSVNLTAEFLESEFRNQTNLQNRKNLWVISQQETDEFFSSSKF